MLKMINISPVLLTFTITILVSHDQTKNRDELFKYFKHNTFRPEVLKRVKEYNPDKDIITLPQLDNKTFFESINDLSIFRRKEVRKLVYLYLTRDRKYTKRAIMRSFLYIDIINKNLKKYPNMPQEIALLPLLESGFNPYAVSPKRAVGLWQIIASTSKTLGLKNDRWIDERRHIEKSTKAAICHLNNLYKIFKSWELALAAYNGGGYHIMRSIRKTGTKDFWELKKRGVLKPETSQYISRFAALILIYKNQIHFGIRNEIDSTETIDTENLVLKYPFNIHNLSIITGIPLKIIRKLNPELKRNVIPPYYREYTFKIPSRRL